ncbi:hypothetical protein [Roseateles violae]|uniref:Uncharacterized protein n=1 Tax=Roseateles violae TaxID=3058042 RepID=A0ABT8DYY9_9BURK|nr:hypothetical protein [Pelomonas sp. PFR6]MDN3922815.1 hypothetical protein [Pelomonas sp. PFR6]
MAGTSRAAESPTPATSPTYAVISLIGDQLGLIGFQPQVGSRLNQNRRGSATMPDAGFDATALRTIQQTMQQADPKANVLLYRITSARLSANPALLFNGETAVIPPAFEEGMKADGANYLILLTRRRGEANMKASFNDQGSGVSLGSGNVEGIGYFADALTPMVNVDTNFSSTGYLAAYVSLQLSLIELSTSKVLAQIPVVESRALAADGSDSSADPWQIVPHEKKAAYTNQLIEFAVGRSLPGLLKAVPAKAR